MTSKTILLVAEMVNSITALKALKLELELRGHKVIAAFGPDQQTADLDIEADLVITGMASSPALAKYELEALSTAAERGTPYGMFADLRGAYAEKARPWFADFRAKASLVIVMDEAEIPGVRAIAPEAIIAPSGHPKIELLTNVLLGRPAVRTALNIGGETSAFTLFYGGSKDGAANKLMLDAVREAAEIGRGRGKTVRVLFGRHPKDLNPAGTYNLDGVEVITDLASDAVMSVVDVVVLGRGSSMIEEALYMGTMPVCLIPETADKAAFAQSGLALPPECACGASPVVASGTELGELIFIDAGRPKLEAACRVRHERYNFIPPKGHAVGIMMTAIESLLAKSEAPAPAEAATSSV